MVSVRQHSRQGKGRRISVQAYTRRIQPGIKILVGQRIEGVSIKMLSTTNRFDLASKAGLRSRKIKLAREKAMEAKKWRLT